ncbi:MAG TPA: protein translocase subunit SecD, partial [Gammaproteobacteria bacterium]
MLNKYPLWKYLLIGTVTFFGLLYAAPNLYGEDPAIQVSSSARGARVDETTLAKALDALEQAKIPVLASSFEEGRLLLRFSGTEVQLKAADPVKEALGTGYVVALNLAPSTPGWLRALNAAPMYLGLDLRGGVHFLMEVDMDEAVRMAEENYVNEVRTLLRDNRVRYLTVTRGSDGVRIKFADAEPRDAARKLVEREFPDLALRDVDDGSAQYLLAALADAAKDAIRKFALQQNITTLRNR